MVILDRDGPDIGHVSLDGVRRELLGHALRIPAREVETHPVARRDARRRSHLDREGPAGGIGRVRSDMPLLCLMLIITGEDHISFGLLGRLGESIIRTVLPRPAPFSTKFPPRMKISSLLLLPLSSSSV